MDDSVQSVPNRYAKRQAWHRRDRIGAEIGIDGVGMHPERYSNLHCIQVECVIQYDLGAAQELRIRRGLQDVFEPPNFFGIRLAGFQRARYR